MALIIPPWLSRDYNPVETYLSAFQTGARIRQEQTRLAEQQRQANMEAQARADQLQQSALHDLVNLQVQKAYHDQSTQLENARLEETKRHNDQIAADALARLEEKRKSDEMMQSLRAREVATKEQLAGEGKVHFGTHGEVLQTMPDGTVKVLRQPELLPSRLRITQEPGVSEPTVTGPPEEVEAYLKSRKEAKAKEAEQASEPPYWATHAGDLLRYFVTGGVGRGVIPPLSNLPPPVEPGPQVPIPSPQSTPGAPQVGDVYKGYYFKGGDPSKKENWGKI